MDPSADVCKERVELLRQWTDLLNHQVKIALELDNVTEYTQDFARHKELLQQAKIIYREVRVARMAYDEHRLKHRCGL